ncbi:MAG: hypothetical protein HYT06_02105 [Candidatus Levybacteria bacterium]|nr:hypothetical protein [Candidatus Levybacteria bacterium]
MRKIIISSYFLVLILFSLFSYLFIDPNFVYLNNFYWGFAFSERFAVTTFYVLFILGFFGFYLYFLKLFREKIVNLKQFKLILLGTLSILFFSYPAMVSYDIFNYTTTAKVLFGYFENPYVVMPIEFPGETFLSYTHASNKIALYGPFWLILTGIPFVLGLGNFLIILLNFKIMISLFYLFSVYLIYKLTKNLNQVVLFALNPLVVIESLVSGHNDIVMMFFVLLSFYLFKNKKIFMSIIFITLSIFIKYATLFLLPVFLYLIFMHFRNKKIDWKKIYLAATASMSIIFFLSPVREEIYPWYGIWFLIFVPFIKNRMIKYIALTFSFSLLLRYIPFMYLGTYFGPTPIIKMALTFVPIIIVVLVLFKNYPVLFFNRFLKK